MNLFEMEAKENLSAFKPLPYRLRPKTMDDILGQEKVVAYFKKMIKSNHLPSCIFFGPPELEKLVYLQYWQIVFHTLTINYRL